ncbi:MAG: Ribokinase [Rhizobium sp.]|nr:Ribokinase [Rhizobium sp.]
MVKIAAMGDNVVDCYLSRNAMFPGGNCLNVSVFIKQFGGHSAYVGAVGKDAAGDVIAAALIEEGVNAAHLRRLDGPTAYCVIGHRNADRVFVTYDLGISMFEPSEADYAFIQGYDAVHIGQSSGLDAHLVRVARNNKLSYDFSDKFTDQRLATIAPHCFLASVSAKDDVRENALALTQQVVAAGAEWALVTRGAGGAILAHGNDVFEVPAYQTSVVDTLGAGDTFIARTLFGLVKGETPEMLLEAAARAAAQTCGYYGAVGHGAPIDIAIDVDALRRSYPDL